MKVYRGDRRRRPHRRRRRRRSTPPTPEARLSRAVPFAGTFHAPLPLRNFLPYGRELMDQGLEAAAVVAFERAAQANPNASTLYRLGTLLAKSGEPGRARAAYERALALQPGSRRGAQRSRHAAGPGRRPRGRDRPLPAALAATPDYPDALNNLGYALLVMGRERRGQAALRAGARAAARLPRGAQQPGPAARARRRPRRRRALLPRRPRAGATTYGEAAEQPGAGAGDPGPDRRGDRRCSRRSWPRTPAFEGTYVTLAKIHLSAGQTAEGLAVLERLLQRNPTHPVAPGTGCAQFDAAELMTWSDLMAEVHSTRLTCRPCRPV